MRIAYNPTDPSEILIVDDTLFTGIYGGNLAGIKTLWVPSGIRAEPVKLRGIIEEEQIYPDYVLTSISGLIR